MLCCFEKQLIIFQKTVQLTAVSFNIMGRNGIFWWIILEDYFCDGLYLGELFLVFQQTFSNKDK